MDRLLGPGALGSELRTAADASGRGPADTDRLIVVFNLTPVPRQDYRIGAPEAGCYRRRLSSDDERFGGSGYPVPERLETEEVAADGCRQSLVLTLPPLAALVLEPDRTVLASDKTVLEPDKTVRE